MSQSTSPETASTVTIRVPKRGISWTPLTVIVVANVLLLLILQFVVGQNLFEPRTLATLTPLLGVMVLIGLAQAFVIGTGGIDLSLPAVVTLMGIVILGESAGENARLPQALLVAGIVCVVVGVLNGILVEVVGLNALVTTLATGQLVTGATVIYRESVNVTRVPPALYEWAQGNVIGVSVILIVAAALALVIFISVRRVVVGRELVLASASLRASTLVGLRSLVLRVSAWVVAALIGGMGGVLLAGQIASPDMSLGSPYLLSSIIVVVLGGAVLTGGRVGPFATMLGATFIILLDHGLAVQGFSSGARTLVQGLVLALGLAGVALLLKPRAARARPSDITPPSSGRSAPGTAT
ncbi:ABC transporter permease [Microbacterium sp. F2]|uniref:ABC transporter permease n=1 Tax=Microbacterium sp. F2 TaxID=3422228 RepID=UPI003FD3ADF6